MNAIVQTEERPPLTRAQAQAARLNSFMGSLEKRQDNLATLLSDSGVDPAFFLAVARRALTKAPDLLDCTPDSLMQAFINAATDGLPPDGRKGAITYFKMKDGSKAAQWNPMVQGLTEIAYRSERFLSIEAQVVYEGESFEYELGDNPYIRHKRNSAAVAARKIVNAYAIAKTTNGGIFREVMEKPDLDKIRNVSRAQNGPNKEWPEEMARKAPLRRLWKYLPKTPAMERVIDHDDRTYDLTAVSVPTAAPKVLKPGFQPRLVHEETPTVDLSMEPIGSSLDDDLDGDPVPAFSGDDEPAARAESPAFPGDDPAPKSTTAREPEPNKTGADGGSKLTIDQRVAAFRARLKEATAKAKVDGVWAASAGLRDELGAMDSPHLPEMEAALEAKYAEIKAAI